MTESSRDFLAHLAGNLTAEEVKALLTQRLRVLAQKNRLDGQAGRGWPARHLADQDGNPAPFHLAQNIAYDSLSRYIAFVAGSQSGKALAVDTPIPTPSGFRKMGDLLPGDEVFDDKGQVCRVVRATEWQYGRRVFRMTFDDGSSILADADHQWATQTANQRKNEARRLPEGARRIHPWNVPTTETSSVVTTLQIKDSLLIHRGVKRVYSSSNHSIAIPLPAQYPERDLPIPPYTFGYWLGNGMSSGSGIVCMDSDVVEYIRAEGVPIGEGRVRKSQGKGLTYYLAHERGEYSPEAHGYVSPQGSFVGRLKELGVFRNKHIPEIYKTASAAQRTALLNGLMDSDGYVGANGTCEYTSVRRQLAEDVLELARSLGIKARLKEGRAKLYGEDKGPKYRVSFTTPFRVARLDRKACRLPSKTRQDTHRVFVVAVEEVDSVPVKCIEVDSPSRLYLAGRNYVVTHNTSFAPWWLAQEIRKRGSGDYLVVSASFDLFKTKLLPVYLQVFCDILKIGRLWSGDKMIELCDPTNGSFWARRSSDSMWGRIILRSANSVGGLESATAKGMHLDEAGMDLFTLAAWRALQRRGALNQARVLITTTLYNLGWLKQIMIDPACDGGQVTIDTTPTGGEIVTTVNKKENITLIQFDSTVNPLFSHEEFERARASMPDDEFNMMYRGRITRPRDLIYDCFSDKENLCEWFDVGNFPEWRRFAGIDFGGTHLAALFLVQEPKTLKYYAYREYLGGNKTAKEHVPGLLEGEIGIPRFFGGAQGEGNWRKEFAQAGIPVQTPGVQDVWLGINRVYSLIKTRKLVFMRKGLEGTLDELMRYRRKRGRDGSATDDIENKNDFHEIDALRYVAASVSGGIGWALGAAQ